MEECLAGEIGTEAFGYKETVYYYINGDADCGLNGSDGNEIVPLSAKMAKSLSFV